MSLLSEDRLGDLAEAFARDARILGMREARRRYRRNLASSLAASIRHGSAVLLQDRALPATAAILIALTFYGCLVRATAETWWIKSGFERNPGYFVSENADDDLICEPLGGEQPASHVVVVPRSARIIKVFCGTPGKPVRLRDDNYTRGRVLAAPFDFRVAWEN